MAYAFLIFEFGGDEEAAQQARHKIDSWKQGFRLGNKLLSKFERTETGGDAAAAKAEGTGAEADATATKSGAAHAKPGATKAKHSSSAKASSAKSESEKEKHKEKKGAKSEEEAAAPAGHIRMLVRLDFSDHEKLSFQRWLDRIPKEEPFQAARGRIVRAGEAEHVKLTDQFDSLT